MAKETLVLGLWLALAAAQVPPPPGTYLPTVGPQETATAQQTQPPPADDSESLEETARLMREWDQHMSDFVPADLVTFEVSARGHEEFYEVIEDLPSKVRGAYFVSGKESKDVDFVIYDPAKQLVYESRKKKEDLFHFEATRRGMYVFMFTNGKFVEKVQLTFALHAGNSTDEVLDKAHLTPVESTLLEVSKSVKDFQMDQQFAQLRQESHYKTVASANRNVFWFSLLECVGVAAVTCWQVYYVKRILDHHLDSEFTPRSARSAENMSLRTSFREEDDQALLASFLGSNSDLLLTNTISLTSLISANKAPFQFESSKKPRRSPLDRHWDQNRRRTFTLDTTNEASMDRRARSAVSRNKSPADSSCNIGNSLYFKGLQMKENVKRRVQMFEKQEKEAERGYFRPKLIENSYLLKPRMHNRIEESLLSWGSKKDEKLAHLKTTHSQAELLDCSFAPKLDSKSVQITEHSRAGHQPRFLELYQMAMQQREQQIPKGKVKNSDCSFHPRIFVEKKVPETQNQFIERLYTSKSRPGEQSRRTEAKEEEHEKEGETEDKKLRRTRTDRPQTLTIHEFLYSLREKQLEAAPSPAPHPPENPASRKVFDHFQHTCISSLFAVLDQNRDGVIAGLLEGAAGFTEKQRAVLAPVIQEIEESQEAWSLDRFEKRITDLISTLNVEDRGYLLTRVKPNYVSPEPTAAFRPRKVAPWLDPVLATSRVSGVILTQKTEKVKAKILKEKKAKEAQECPFKPFLTSLETQRYVANKSLL